MSFQEHFNYIASTNKVISQFSPAHDSFFACKALILNLGAHDPVFPFGTYEGCALRFLTQDSLCNLFTKKGI